MFFIFIICVYLIFVLFLFQVFELIFDCLVIKHIIFINVNLCIYFRNMDEKKLKVAFSKVKGEISILSGDIAKVRMQVAQVTRDGIIEEKSKGFDNSNNEEFMKGLEVEVLAIKKLVSELSGKMDDNFKKSEANEFDISIIKNDLKTLDGDISECSEKIDVSNSKSDMKSTCEDVTSEQIVLMNEKLTDFQELVNEKLSTEIAELRLEMTEEISKVFDNMTKGLEKIDKNDREKSKPDEPVLDSKQRTLVEEVVLEDEFPQMKEGRFKKVIKWLFVDEEDEFEVLKDEVRETTSKKK